MYMGVLKMRDPRKRGCFKTKMVQGKENWGGTSICETANKIEENINHQSLLLGGASELGIVGHETM